MKLHREKANKGYKTITKMSKIAKEDPHTLVIAVDLQRALKPQNHRLVRRFTK